MHVRNGCRVGPGRTVCTFVVGLCVRLNWVVLLLIDTAYEVVYTIYNGDDDSALISVCWMYEIGVVLARSGWTGRTFVLRRVSLKLKVSLLLNTVWGRNFMLAYYTTRTMKTAVCIEFRLMNLYGIGFYALCLDEQRVRLYYLNLTYVILLIDAVWGRNLTFENVLSKYTTMAMTALCCSSFVECMKWMSCWYYTNSTYVLTT